MRKMLPAFVVTLATFAFSIWALPQLPPEVATHWGVDGQPNDWSSPAFAALLMPGIMLFMSAIFAALPNIDPLKRNYQFHGSVYFLLGNVIVGFMGAVQVLILGSALGWPLDMRPNWFMGIRTPWTLSSERVWRKTHRVGGYTFILAGLVFIATAFVATGETGRTVMFVSIFPLILWPVVYSYLEWRREKAERTAGERPLSS
jgi:uncharacterized membrane protein